ncbi:hypothetical protein ACFX2K_036115 [Malus domestica]
MRNELVARRPLIVDSLTGRTRCVICIYTAVMKMMGYRPKPYSASAGVNGYGLPMAMYFCSVEDVKLR